MDGFSVDFVQSLRFKRQRNIYEIYGDSFRFASQLLRGNHAVAQPMSPYVRRFSVAIVAPPPIQLMAMWQMRHNLP